MSGAKHTLGLMDAEQVRAFAEAKWPKAMQSPLAQAMHGASAMALLEASDADNVITEYVGIRRDAMEHAERCLDACGGWTVETLGFNIESAFGGELDPDECDDIARAALAKTIGSAA